MGGIHRVVVTVVIVILTLAGTSGRAAVILDSLLVRIYDNAGVLARDRTRAMKSARDILARADLDVQWRDCPARGNLIRTACAAVLGPGELSVRLVRSLEGDAQTGVLGNALIDTATGRGTLATVFVDRVVSVSHTGKADSFEMVGRVMAHEIGHLLLGSNSHTESGLMREMWSIKDLLRNRREDWQFSRAQRETLKNWRMAIGALRGLTGVG
jgi:hypothetical protein